MSRPLTSFDGRWRVVVGAGVRVDRTGFDEEPRSTEVNDLMREAGGAGVYPPEDPAPDALADAVDYVVNDLECERLRVSREQAAAVIQALGGVAS